VNQQETRLDFSVPLRAVDGEGDGMLHVHLRGVEGWLGGGETTPGAGGVSMREGLSDGAAELVGVAVQS